MFNRLIFTFIFLLCMAGSAPGAILYPVNDPILLESAKEMGQKNYIAAKDIALKAKDNPSRNFLLGMTYYRLAMWDDASRLLATSVDDLALVGDYALFYRADCLFRLGRYDEAVDILQKLKKAFPQCPLAKAAASLYAESLFNKKDYSAALDAYRKYVESYPSGSKAIRAVLQAALCREGLGDKEKAVRDLRTIWLKYPASPVASLAEAHLQRLQSEGLSIAPFTGEELYNRGIMLYDLQRYSDALKAFSSVAPDSLPARLRSRLALRTAQTLFGCRQYKNAQDALKKLAFDDDRETSGEALYWLAKTLDRAGDEQQALTLYAKVAEKFPKSDMADDALYYQALIKKNDHQYGDAIAILYKLISKYPSSVLSSRASWDIAWNSYLKKDYKAAMERLTALQQDPSYREKALYWVARAREASGEKEEADATYVRLTEEFPFGFYSLYHNKRIGATSSRIPSLTGNEVAVAGLSSGFARAKVLITLGLTEEAEIELGSVKQRVTSRNGMLELALLYWEMQKYHSAMALFKKIDMSDTKTLGFIYPKAFSSQVARHAGKQGIQQSLAYSIIRAESNFSPTAVSPTGAVGLMQVMPGTARFLDKDNPAVRLTQPEVNIRLGLKHLKDLLVRYKGDEILAIAAYNSGATPVDRWRKRYPGLQDDEFIENIPYAETREYVKKVFSNIQIYRSLYALDIPSRNVPQTTASQQSPQEAAISDTVAAK